MYTQLVALTQTRYKIIASQQHLECSEKLFAQSTSCSCFRRKSEILGRLTQIIQLRLVLRCARTTLQYTARFLHLQHPKRSQGNGTLFMHCT